MHLKVGIIITTYNVEKTIGKVLDAFSPSLLNQIEEILVIDNDSPDGTAAAVKSRMLASTALGDRLSLLQHAQNYGYGSSIKSGMAYFQNTGVTHVAVVHGDYQNNPAELLTNLFAAANREPSPDLVLASRFLSASDVSEYSLVRKLGNWFFNFFTFLCTGLRISDSGTAMTLVRRETLAKLPFATLSNTWHFHPQLNILAFSDKTIKIVEIPMVWADSEAGSSLKLFRYGWELGKLLCRYAWLSRILGLAPRFCFHQQTLPVEHRFTLQSHASNAPIRIHAMKHVEKPWGSELLVAETPKYALKDIRLNKGTRSSLQSHVRKLETILVMDGSIELETWNANGERLCEAYQSGQAYTIPPGTRHRVSASEDCRLIEVSTPDLDDVIRHEDDFGRELNK
jgi:mannose-6-phosphate isomerase